MSKQDTAIALRRLANLVKGVIQAADDIEAIGSLENSTREATEARDKAQAERDAALAELSDAKAKGAKAVKEAKDKADKLLDDAQALADSKAAETLGRADAYATQITKDAAEQVAQALVRGNADLDMVRRDVDSLTGQRAAMTTEVADLEAKAKFAQAEHDKLTKALDALKAKFRIDA